MVEDRKNLYSLDLSGGKNFVSGCCRAQSREQCGRITLQDGFGISCVEASLFQLEAASHIQFPRMQFPWCKCRGPDWSAFRYLCLSSLESSQCWLATALPWCPCLQFLLEEVVSCLRELFCTRIKWENLVSQLWPSHNGFIF